MTDRRGFWRLGELAATKQCHVFIAESRKTAYLHGLAIRSSAFAGVNYHPGSLLKE